MGSQCEISKSKCLINDKIQMPKKVQKNKSGNRIKDNKRVK